MIRAIALCALTSPAYAADSAEWCHGLGMASIAASGAEYVVTVVNPYCQAGAWADDLEVVTLDVDGLRVTLQVWSEPGLTPDAFVVLPPSGWLADPASLTVEEHESGTIRLVMVALS